MTANTPKTKKAKNICEVGKMLFLYQLNIWKNYAKNRPKKTNR
jgi:hypothetical protein